MRNAHLPRNKEQSPSPSLILASASPRRSALLRQAGVVFTVVPSHVPEEVRVGETPDAYARRVAREKATDVAEKHPGTWVLAADTIVEINGEVLGKPRDKEDAHRMLRHLSGRAHRVKTAFVLLDGNGQVFTSQVVTSTVKFRPLSDAQIQSYLSTGEPFDKAGAYAVQGRGAAFVERVEGSYTNVIGLPTDEVLQVLQTAELLGGTRTHE